MKMWVVFKYLTNVRYFMDQEINVGDYVEVCVDRISNNGNAIALTPKNGYLHVINGEDGEKAIVKVTKRKSGLIGEKVSAPSGAEIKRFEEFYQEVEDHREQKKREKREFENNKPKPPTKAPADKTAKMYRLEQSGSNNEKSKRDRERENLNRVLKGDM